MRQRLRRRLRHRRRRRARQPYLAAGRVANGVASRATAAMVPSAADTGGGWIEVGKRGRPLSPPQPATGAVPVGDSPSPAKRAGNSLCTRLARLDAGKTAVPAGGSPELARRASKKEARRAARNASARAAQAARSAVDAADTAAGRIAAVAGAGSKAGRFAALAALQRAKEESMAETLAWRPGALPV